MKKIVFSLLFLCVATNSVLAQQLSVKSVDVRIEPDPKECTMIKGEEPTKHVATWQTENYYDGNKDINISREEIFGLGDFPDLEMIDD